MKTIKTPAQAVDALEQLHASAVSALKAAARRLYLVIIIFPLNSETELKRGVDAALLAHRHFARDAAKVDISER